MDTRPIAALLGEHPLFAGFDEETMTFLAGCATNHHFPVDKFLFRADQPADQFYLVRSGDVVLELDMTGRKRLVVQSIHSGEVVGASWMLPPYRWRFDARAVDDVRAIGIDATCLRDKCDGNPELGYQIFKRFLPIVADRLLAARVQLVDLYAPPSEVGAAL
ncbi:MAG: Crp/Fnr family transcriptional regulator [Alphaproteobacteria bacterium]